MSPRAGGWRCVTYLSRPATSGIRCSAGRSACCVQFSPYEESAARDGGAFLWQGCAVPTIAGAVELSAVMDKLRAVRPVFHSEADFQHAFAWVLHEFDGSIQVRLEVGQEDRKELDLLCMGADSWTAVEFKYFTAAWQGSAPGNAEVFRLRNHAARDLARLGFVSDIARLERFCGSSRIPMNGLAIMLTNDRALWSPPSTPRPSRDEEFRIHEGRTLAGTLRWGNGDYPANQRDLAGKYQLAWQSYSTLPGKNGEFRWLAVCVASDPLPGWAQ